MPVVNIGGSCIPEAGSRDVHAGVVDQPCSWHKHLSMSSSLAGLFTCRVQQLPAVLTRSILPHWGRCYLTTPSLILKETLLNGDVHGGTPLGNVLDMFKGLEALPQQTGDVTSCSAALRQFLTTPLACQHSAPAVWSLGSRLRV